MTIAAKARSKVLPLRLDPAHDDRPFFEPFAFPFLDHLYSFDGLSLVALQQAPGASFSRWWEARAGAIIVPDLAKASLWRSNGNAAAKELSFSPDGWTAAACLQGALLAFARVYEPERGFAYRLYPNNEALDAFFEGHLGLFVSDIAFRDGCFLIAGATREGDEFQLWSLDTSSGETRRLAVMKRTTGFLRVLSGSDIYCYVSSASKEDTGDSSIYTPRNGAFVAIPSKGSPLVLLYGSGFALGDGRLLLPGISKDASASLVEARVQDGTVRYGTVRRLPAPSYQALGVVEGSAILVCYDHFAAPGDFILARVSIE